ncbi:MAG: NUDIX domain-containing protein [bacterium]|nr:NUDIX domain-containing protein [bacterium]
MAVRNISVLALYNKDKEILLQHRDEDAKRLPNYWGFFGGGIEKGETPEAALEREIFEELEYKVSKPVRVLVQKFNWKEDENIKYVFVEEYDSSQPLIQHEGQGKSWRKFDDLGNLQMIDHDMLAIAEIRKFLGV